VVSKPAKGSVPSVIEQLHASASSLDGKGRAKGKGKGKGKGKVGGKANHKAHATGKEGDSEPQGNRSKEASSLLNLATLLSDDPT
jgi:hypothetical protein